MRSARSMVLSNAMLLGMLMLSCVVAHAQVVSTSPGQNSVFTSGNVLFSGFIADLDGTIKKGKKGMVLEIEGQGQVFGCTSNVDVFAIVNGLVPNFGDVYIVPTGATFNSNSGVWWLDLDAAEKQNKHSFIGKPLNITLRADSAFCPNGATFAGTLRARLVQK